MGLIQVPPALGADFESYFIPSGTATSPVVFNESYSPGSYSIESSSTTLSSTLGNSSGTGTRVARTTSSASTISFAPPLRFTPTTIGPTNDSTKFFKYNQETNQLFVSGQGNYVNVFNGTNGNQEFFWNIPFVTWGAMAASTSVYALFGNNGNINTSTNPNGGTGTWTTRSSGISGNFQDAVYGGGWFYAVTSTAGQYVRSSDGINWTSATFGSDELRRVEFLNGFIYVGGMSGRFGYASPGSGFSSLTSPLGAETINAFGYGNGVYLMAGTGGNIATSTNGTTWTSRSTSQSSSIAGIGYAKGLYWSVQDKGLGQDRSIMVSTSGVTWSNAPGTTNLQSSWQESTYSSTIGAPGAPSRAGGSTDWVFIAHQSNYFSSGAGPNGATIPDITVNVFNYGTPRTS